MSDAPDLVKISNYEYGCSRCREFKILIPENMQPDLSWIQARFKHHIERHHCTEEQPKSATIGAKPDKRTRGYALREYVMSAMADDYESLETIVESVNWMASENDLPGFAMRDVQPTVAELVREGYASAYILSPTPPHSTIVDYSDNRADELWFMLTAAGIRAMNEQD